MKRPFVFFDLGQTLVDEWDFINYLDSKFLELLNGFGARMDMRSYLAVRDDAIRSRRIGHGGVRELIGEVCRLVLQPGYDRIVAERLEPEIMEGRKNLFRFFDDAEEMLHFISARHDLGIIANQSEDIAGLLAGSGLGKLFKVQAISSSVKLRKPDPEIFRLALERAGCQAGECIMVGDRLDTDICPANKLGMEATIRTTNSLFRLQNPTSECEYPTHIVSRLSEIPAILEKM